MALAIALVMVLSGCSSANQTRVIVGAGTTLVDSLFMAEIVEIYGEVAPSTQPSIVGFSSAEAIALAEAGDADVIITHNREALDAFLASMSVLSLVRVANTTIENPYDLTVIDPTDNAAAAAFAAWMTSPEGVAATERANMSLFDEQVYVAP